MGLQPQRNQIRRKKKSEENGFSQKATDTLPTSQQSQHPLVWSTSAKYLGIILDRKLLLSQQAKAVRNKTNAAYQSLKHLFNNNKVSKHTKMTNVELHNPQHQHLRYHHLGSYLAIQLQTCERNSHESHERSIELPLVLTYSAPMKKFRLGKQKLTKA